MVMYHVANAGNFDVRMYDDAGKNAHHLLTYALKAALIE